MSGLQLNLTPEGRAAIVNPDNTGTSAMRVGQIGVSASGAGLVNGALDGEIKRLVTFAGAAVADDTIHVTICDDSTGVYTLRSFALYLENGTLLGWYAQAGVILEKSAQAMLLLAADIQFPEIDVANLTFGDTNWINPPATTEIQGVIEVATNAESLAGADATRAVPPAGLKHVLDQRFGMGAPTAFAKGLLALATAATMRLALEIKSAALKEEGAGNGLDADKLDGQHGAYYLSWGNLTGKPASFPPSAHTHAWTDLADPPSTATRWPDWTEITGKPLAFAPAAHTHAAADITSGTLADARIAQSNVTQHQGALSIAWTQVTGKPATFTPSAHAHAAADITSGTLAVARIPALPMSQTTNLQATLDAKAPLASPVFSGTVGVGTQSGGGIGNLRIEDAADPRIGWTTTGSRRWTAGNNGTGWTLRDETAAADRITVTSAGVVSFGANAAWHAGNFNPATKANVAGQVFTGTVRVQNGAVGYAELTTGGASTPGYLGFFTADSTRRGYIGWASGTNLVFNAETGWGWVFNGAVTFSNGASVTGTLTATTVNATSSDRRLKYDIEDLRDCLATVLRMRPRSYRLRSDDSEDFGFVAQEHREVGAQFVHQAEPAEDGEEGMMFVRYGKAEPYLAGAIAELHARMNAFDARLRAAGV